MKKHLQKCADKSLFGNTWTKNRVALWALEQIKKLFPRAYKKLMRKRKRDDQRQREHEREREHEADDENEAAEEIRIATGGSMSPV